MIRFSVFVAVFFLVACKPKEDKSGDIVARVADQYLYVSDLNGLVAEGTAIDDSLKLIEKYIDTWAKEKLLLKKAEENLTDEQKDVAKQLEEYRKSLVIYSYERELVSQLLDTNVSDEEIAAYYENNKNNFELRNNIIKVLYVKVSKKAPSLDKVKKWYTSDSPKDISSLEVYCHQYAQNFYLDDNAWLLFDDILKEIPIETYNQELFLKNNRFVQVEDSVSLYFLNIKGFKTKNSISPLSFEQENIRNIILNKRKMELLAQMKNDIYQAAIKNNDVEIKKIHE